MDITPVHLLIVLVIVLLLFGAKRLPEMGRSIGSSAREFKKGISGDESVQSTQTPVDPPATPVETHDAHSN